MAAPRQAKLQIEAMIGRRNGAGAGQVFQLPSEEDLSTTLGWSRATIRSALILLEKEGKVRRIHGSGTFVNSHACAAPANIGDDLAFLDVLGRLGYRPGQRVIDVALTPLPDAACEILGLAPATPGWRVERLFFASGQPAAFSIDAVPAIGGDGPPIEPERSTFSMVRGYAGRTISYSVARLVPTVVTGRVAEVLGLVAGAAVLLLRHTHVDEGEQVVAVTDAYVNADLIPFSVVRTVGDAR